MKFHFALAAALALATAGAAPAGAHHSMAMFDQGKQVTVTGTVKQFQWTNPHSYIQLMVTSDAGKQVEWSLELGAPMYLYARGWRPRTLGAGDKISVTLYPLRNGHPGGAVIEVTTAEGRKLGQKA